MSKQNLATARQVWPEVVRDMLQRNETGRAKYNRYLQDDCPDNMVQHAYEEALDLTVYLKTILMKQNQVMVKPKETSRIKSVSEEISEIFINLHKESNGS